MVLRGLLTLPCLSLLLRLLSPVTWLWVTPRGLLAPRVFTPRSPSSWILSTLTRVWLLAYAYDIVCNGNEIGGGSIRIHRRDVQERVFAVMGIGEEEAQEKFASADASKYGAPPMGGNVFGWDRIVSLLAGADSIREVIASRRPVTVSTC